MKGTLSEIFNEMFQKILRAKAWVLIRNEKFTLGSSPARTLFLLIMCFDELAIALLHHTWKTKQKITMQLFWKCFLASQLYLIQLSVLSRFDVTQPECSLLDIFRPSTQWRAGRSTDHAYPMVFISQKSPLIRPSPLREEFSIYMIFPVIDWKKKEYKKRFFR